MDKSAFELVSFILYTELREEQRAIIMYSDKLPRPCKKCGGVHIEISEMYYHYN